MRTISIVLLVLLLASPILALDQPYGGIRLLDGYRFERGHTFDTINGVISKEGGLRIEFESGINEGYGVEPKNKTKYLLVPRTNHKRSQSNPGAREIRRDAVET